MNRTLQTTLCGLAVAALLAGCGSSVNLAEPPVETRTPVPVAGARTPAGTSVGATPTPVAPSANPAGTPESRVATVDLARTPVSAAPTGRIVYFDFDSFVIRDDFKPLIEGHARSLAAQRARRMTVEGHTDERGSREYNLALGQKRAEAVLRSLALLGANETQLEAVSFGEERPTDEGRDEAAWAKNRRAELKDR